MNLIQEKISLPEVYNPPVESVQLAWQLLSESKTIQLVNDSFSQSLAINAGSAIRKHVKEVESARQELTAPLLEAQRKLKKLADDHVAPLNLELARVQKLVVQFQLQEAERVERERQAQIKAYEEAERVRQEAVLAAQKAAEKVNTERQLDRAIQKEQAALEASQAVQTVLAAPLPTVNRATGASLRKVLRYEVLDIRKVYAARPELCVIEIKKSAVQATCVPEMHVPGLKLWWETAASIRG
jgi:hypothetical protein